MRVTILLSSSRNRFVYAANRPLKPFFTPHRSGTRLRFFMSIKLIITHLLKNSARTVSVSGLHTDRTINTIINNVFETCGRPMPCMVWNCRIVSVINARNDMQNLFQPLDRVRKHKRFVQSSTRYFITRICTFKGIITLKTAN